MLIVCPSCASEYQIEASYLGASGRSVRCAACRGTWFVAPEADATEAGTPGPDASGAGAPADAAEAPAVIDQPMPRRRAARPARPASRLRLPRRVSPAAAAALAVLAVVPLALLGRTSVVQAMPRTAGLFARLGLPVNLRGIDLRDVAAYQTPAEGGAPARLVVEGDLVGVGRGRAAVAPIEVEVRDAGGHPLYRWTVPPPRAGLEAGETARFRASLSAPPAQGRGVEVRFAAAEAAPVPGAGPAHGAPKEQGSEPHGTAAPAGGKPAAH